MPFTFIFVGTYSGMNLNIFLIILSFFGVNSLLSKKLNKIFLKNQKKKSDKIDTKIIEEKKNKVSNTNTDTKLN